MLTWPRELKGTISVHAHDYHVTGPTTSAALQPRQSMDLCMNRVLVAQVVTIVVEAFGHNLAIPYYDTPMLV